MRALRCYGPGGPEIGLCGQKGPLLKQYGWQRREWSEKRAQYLNSTDWRSEFNELPFIAMKFVLRVALGDKGNVHLFKTSTGHFGEPFGDGHAVSDQFEGCLTFADRLWEDAVDVEFVHWLQEVNGMTGIVHAPPDYHPWREKDFRQGRRAAWPHGLRRVWCLVSSKIDNRLKKRDQGVCSRARHRR
jgi:hypothetical protein